METEQIREYHKRPARKTFMRSGSETENKIRISNVKPRKVKRDIKERQ
jgi:uncharacterized protein YaaW (UPF0174 family)